MHQCPAARLEHPFDCAEIVGELMPAHMLEHPDADDAVEPFRIRRREIPVVLQSIPQAIAVDHIGSGAREIILLFGESNADHVTRIAFLCEAAG